MGIIHVFCVCHQGVVAFSAAPRAWREAAYRLPAAGRFRYLWSRRVWTVAGWFAARLVQSCIFCPKIEPLDKNSYFTEEK